MSDPQQFRLRCTYGKQGRLALLSHLEVAHTLERTVRRAGLPYAVSQGFSPHMRIAFGAALPVGVGSTCEIFDLQLLSYVAPERALKALQQASVTDLMVKSCEYVEPQAPAASVAFPFSTYEVRFDGRCSVDDVTVPSQVTVVRKRKEKVLQVNDYLCGPFEFCGDCGDTARFTLEAKPTGSLRPDVLCDHCDFPVGILSITRIAQSSRI